MTTPEEQIHRVWRRSVEASHEFLSPAEIDEIDQQLTVSRFFHQDDFILHRDDSGTIKAFVLVSETDTQTHMEALFVDPECFGSGISYKEWWNRRGRKAILRFWLTSTNRTPGRRNSTQKWALNSTVETSWMTRVAPIPFCFFRDQ
ncbi:Acetyltransferase, putative [Yarrowia lipolytica]|jgi:hypothetical protein|nr:Acetyltransferase, putative [Yarrowia lipolytica]